MNRLIKEFLETFFLAFTTRVSAAYQKAGLYAPLAIGFVLVAMVGKLSIAQIWIPILGSLIGKIAAVLIFNLGHPTETCSPTEDADCKPIDY